MMNKKKKQSRFNLRSLAAMLVAFTFLTIIMIVIMLSVPNNTNTKKRSQVKKEEASNKQDELKEYKEVLAVIKEIDLEEMKILLYDIKQQEELSLTYSGASEIEDKYNQPISIRQIPIGSVVDVKYSGKNSKINQIQISNQAWEYAGVNNLTINETSKEMKIASTKYRYNNDITVVDQNRFISVKDLETQDELTVRGYEEVIWSITVTRGHGTLVLEDYDTYLGGNISVGYQAMQTIAEDMKIIVREGTFNLTVENGRYSGVKNVTILRDQETKISLAGLGPEAVKTSLITFSITPFGADLYINSELTSYDDPIELVYGNYPITVSLGGYRSFTGTLLVNSAGKSINIDLPEVKSNENAEVSVDDGVETEGPEADPSENGDWISDEDREHETDTGSQNGNDTDTDIDENIDEEHFIYVQNPLGASVYIDGEFMGISPGSFQKKLGSHVITFIKEGYLTQSYTLEIEDDGLDTYVSLPSLVIAE